MPTASTAFGKYQYRYTASGITPARHVINEIRRANGSFRNIVVGCSKCRKSCLYIFRNNPRSRRNIRRSSRSAARVSYTMMSSTPVVPVYVYICILHAHCINVVRYTARTIRVVRSLGIFTSDIHTAIYAAGTVRSRCR